MDLYSRYVFKQVLNALLMIMGSLAVVVWIATSLKQVENLSTGGFWLFFQMTSLAMPQAMSIVAPFALLIACLYSLHKLNLDSELIVMTASGASVWQLIRPYALLGLLLSLLVLFSNVYVQPTCLQKLRSFIIQVRADLISHVLMPGKFSTSGGKLTFHIRDRSKNGDLLGLLVVDGRNNAEQMTYLAEVGEMIKVDDNAYLKMRRGHIHRKAKGKDGVQIVKFDEYVLDLSEFGGKRQGPVQYKARERHMSGLLNPSESDRKWPKMMGFLRAELHNRFSSALYPLLFALLAVACLGIARSNRQAGMRVLLIGFTLGVAVRMGGLMTVNLLRVHPSAVWLVYGLPLLSILLCLLYMWAMMCPERFGGILRVFGRGKTKKLA